MAANTNINIVIKAKTMVGNVVGLTVLRPLSSSMPQLTTNEIPILLNSIVNGGYLDQSVQVGFTYTFPFNLARSRGFPYALSFQFEGAIRLA